MSESSNANNPLRTSRPELTSYQLVIGICLALAVAVVLFVCGYILGSWRSSDMGSVAKVDRKEPAPSVTTERPFQRDSEKANRKPAGDATQKEGTQVSPRPPKVELPTAKPPSKKPADGSDVQADKPVAIVPAPASPAPASATPPEPSPAEPAAPGPAPEAAASQPAAASPAKPLGPEEDVPVLPDSLPTAVPAPVPLPVASTPAQPPPAEPPLPVPAPATETPQLTGGFAIQIAAYSGANRQKLAEAYARQLAASDSTLKTALMPSEDGKAVRVLIGPFADRPSAEARCRELRKRATFKDCFVKALP